MLEDTTIIVVVAPLMILTEIVMTRAIPSCRPRDVTMLGGHQGARSIHFIGMHGILVHAEYRLSKTKFEPDDPAPLKHSLSR